MNAINALTLLWLLELVAGDFFMGGVLVSYLTGAAYPEVTTSTGGKQIRKQITNRLFNPIMPVTGLIWLVVLLVILCVVSIESPKSPAFALMTGALICWLSFFIITVLIEIRITPEIAKWVSASLDTASLDADTVHQIEFALSWRVLYCLWLGAAVLSFLLSSLALLLSI